MRDIEADRGLLALVAAAYWEPGMSFVDAVADADMLIQAVDDFVEEATGGAPP